DYILYPFIRGIEQYILVGCRCHYRIKAEEHLVENFTLFRFQIFIGYYNSLRIHYYTYFLKTVGYQSTTRTDNIEYRICQTNAGSNFYRTCNFVDLSLNLLFLKELL